MTARVIQVIQVETSRGEGKTVDDPYRKIYQYYSFDGELLAERDDWEECKKEEQEHFNWQVGANLCCLCGNKVEPLHAQMAERNSNGQIYYYHYGCWQYKNQQEHKATQTQEGPGL